MGRVAGLLLASLLTLASAACSSDGAASQQSTPGQAGRPSVSAEVRTRLAAGLAAVSQAKSELVRAEHTSVTPVEVAWLDRWRVFDVQSHAGPHPQRFYAALDGDGAALVLSGSPESFNRMTRDTLVADASLATDLGALYLDVTRAFDRYSYRIEAVSEIQWPYLEPAQAKQRDEFTARHAQLVRPAQAEPSGSGWTVTAWMIDGTSLVRHRLSINDGILRDYSDVVATGLPLPVSI